LFGGMRIALLDGGQDAGDIAHAVQDNRLAEDRQTIERSPCDDLMNRAPKCASKSRVLNHHPAARVGGRDVLL
jgi:hypothetical protein